MPNRRQSLLTTLLMAVSLTSLGGSGLDAAHSKVTATFRQMKVPVEAEFKAITGTVSFDAAKPTEASAQLEIATASFDIGDEDYNAEVRKPEWFDSARFPKASFVSRSVKSLGNGRYQVSGAFMLKGKTQDLSFVMTASPEGRNTRFEGSFPLSRKAFGVGDPAWAETVDDTVTVHFVVIAGA
jgi:polyisoprenoid-binding protein YceI